MPIAAAAENCLRRAAPTAQVLGMKHCLLRPSLALSVCLVAATMAVALTSPKEHFGFAIGDDYQLTTYTQVEAYFKKLAGESDRLKLVDIGQTEEGRTQWMMICTSPANPSGERHHHGVRTLGAGERPHVAGPVSPAFGQAGSRERKRDPVSTDRSLAYLPAQRSGERPGTQRVGVSPEKIQTCQLPES